MRIVGVQHVINTQDEQQQLCDKDCLNPIPSSFVNFEKIKKYFFIGMRAYGAYSLLDEGIANVLGLETLRHGDSLIHYISGNLFGIDPATRSGLTGSCVGSHMLARGVVRDCFRSSKGYFYVFKDSKFDYDDCSPIAFLPSIAYKLGLSRWHAILSGISTTAAENTNRISFWGRILLGGLNGAVTPTMKFRYTLDNLQQFENDPDYCEAAYRTREPISVAHMGILGSLWQGMNSGVFYRIADRPYAALVGVALIGLSILVAKKTWKYAWEMTSECRFNAKTMIVIGLIFLNTL